MQSSKSFPALPERKVIVAFLLFVFFAGGASVAIRILYADMAPFWLGFTRFGLGALVFWIIAARQRLPIPKGRALVGAMLFGTMTTGLAFVLIAYGLVATPASLYQIIAACIPLLTLFLSALQGVESLSWRGVAGSMLAVLGIAYIMGGASASQLSMPHLAAIFISTLFMAEGGVLIKKFPPNPPVMTNAISMTIGAIIQLAASILNGEKWSFPTHLQTWLAFIYLVLFVTVIAIFLYMFVLNKWTASGTSYGFVLIPLVTIVVASKLAGETITAKFLLGAAMVLIGVLVGALLPSKKQAVVVEECKDRSGQVIPRCI